VAVAPDGRLAAFCVGWLNDHPTGEVNGQIDPMGVHADYHRLGLGRAILYENLRRMYMHGARQVFVETDSYRNPAMALYEVVGFRVFREILVYRKDYQVG
jgi:ribosomal protein S18 acetylase RimI-like enzyme